MSAPDDPLASELVGLFRRGVDAPLGEEAFRELALRVFAHQFEENRVYREYCRRRGRTPETVSDWREVPPVPTSAFKELPLVAGDPDSAEAVFLTTGTTRGARGRGRHHVRDLTLYDEALLPNFRAHLLPDGAELPGVALLPSPEAAPDSSLSYMAGVVLDRAAAPGGGFFMGPGWEPRWEELEDRLAGLAWEGRAVLLMGTAFAFVHLLDRLAAAGRSLPLPEGSRVMETGGFKGRSRAVSREELYRAVEERLGIPAGRIVNEYGMTEMLSQFYEPVLREGEGPGARLHRPPPWVRTRVLDPATLEELPPGRAGLLHHFDLANLHSVSSLLTEDLGEAVEGGFRLLGRAGGAEPRGCSLALEELLAASGEGG